MLRRGGVPFLAARRQVVRREQWRCITHRTAPIPSGEQALRTYVFGAIVFAGVTYSFVQLKGYIQGTSEIADMESLRNDVEQLLLRDPSLGPLIIRLVWTASMTIDDPMKTTVFCVPTSPDGKGLDRAVDALAPLKRDGLSHPDTWVFASCVALECLGFPKVPFRHGRGETMSGPTRGIARDAQPDDIRRAYHTVGVNEKEAVALMAAHSLGRMHKEISGVDGRWVATPGAVEEYFRKLLEPAEKDGDVYRTKDGLIRLPVEQAMMQDKMFRYWAEAFGKGEGYLMQTFRDAWVKLTEAGWQSSLKLYLPY